MRDREQQFAKDDGFKILEPHWFIRVRPGEMNRRPQELAVARLEESTGSITTNPDLVVQEIHVARSVGLWDPLKTSIQKSLSRSHWWEI
jgi:hypothetical protein